MGEPERVIQKQASGFLSLPKTGFGRCSARLLLLSFALILLNTYVVMPSTEGRTGLELLQTAYNFATFLCLFSSGVCGLIALMKRERSWAVAVSVLCLILVMAYHVFYIIHHGF